jgi:hypothetical protein
MSENNTPTREFIDKEYYSNILLVTQNLAPLTTINKKRANWYIKNNLGEELDKDTLAKDYPRFSRVIRLKFKAKLEDRNNPFYLQILETQCVVCGEREAGKLSLHHVVPSVIRKHFPEEHKNHSHGWCVLLCEKHHMEADRLAQLEHSAELKVLEEKIRIETTRLKNEWAQDFIQRKGGIENVKAVYRDRFKQMDPKHLPDGFLNDHSLKLDLTNEEISPTIVSSN